jgi:hypothetical protein
VIVVVVEDTLLQLKRRNDEELIAVASLSTDEQKSTGLQDLLDQLLDFVPSKARERLALDELSTNRSQTRYYEVIASQYATVDTSVLCVEQALIDLRYNRYFPPIFAVCLCKIVRRRVFFSSSRLTIEIFR